MENITAEPAVAGAEQQALQTPATLFDFLLIAQESLPDNQPQWDLNRAMIEQGLDASVQTEEEESTLLQHLHPDRRALQRQPSQVQAWTNWANALDAVRLDQLEISTDTLLSYLLNGFPGSVVIEDRGTAIAYAAQEYTGDRSGIEMSRFVLWADAVAYAPYRSRTVPVPFVTETVTLAPQMWSNEAEVWAIVNALEMATNLIQRTRSSNAMVTPQRVVVIYSDNISALFRVKACPIGRSAPIWEMVEKTCTYTAAIEQYGFGVELRWIPGHVDALEGHNEADRAAGRARRNQNTYILSFDYVESLDEEGNAMDPFAK